MTKKNWTFLSNHLRIFAYLAEHPDVTAQRLAYKTSLSIRAVQIILGDLEQERYLSKERIGRNNRYKVNPDKPLRHRLEKKHCVGDLLRALGIETEGKTVRGSYFRCRKIKTPGNGEIYRKDLVAV
jgi:DNA-binding transcriptional ArsR family regulator